MKRHAVLGAGVLALGMGMTLSVPAQAECSAENWQDCQGKPWTEGDTMDTPLGSKWWPHPVWGGGRRGRLYQLVHQSRSGDARRRAHQRR